MHKLWLLPLLLSGACATDPGDAADDFSPADHQAVPVPDGKSDDARACGDETCTYRECGYDCTAVGAQCTERCAPAPARSTAFVSATVAGSTVDSRDTPFAEVFALDNVLIYGCELWDFSNQTRDGLEIQLKELRHSSFTVNPNDPTRHDRRLMVYVDDLQGPGSYRGEGMFQASNTAPLYYAKDACAIDVAASADGGLTGTFDCRLPAQGANPVAMTGTFACPIDAMSPIFTRWTPAT